MTNRLTVSTLACPNWPLRRIIEQSAAAGVEGVDFRGVLGTVDHTLLPEFGSRAGETRSLLKRFGLAVPCMCSSVKLMIADEHDWQSALDEFRRYLDVADAFDSPFIRIFPGQSPGTLTRNEAANLGRRRANELANLAQPFRVKPLLETHDDWGAAAQVVKLLADCQPEEFGVIWDIRHTWAAGETPEQAIASLGPRLRHVHVKDSVLVEGKERPALLGEGVVPVGDSLRALRQAGYEGWICLETEKRWYAATAPEPEVSISQFVQFARIA